MLPLAKVDRFTTVLFVISVSSVWRWAVASNERAVANARAASTECSRARVERAEVEHFLSQIERSTQEITARAATTGR
jgi:hypothetical protein